MPPPFQGNKALSRPNFTKAHRVIHPVADVELGGGRRSYGPIYLRSCALRYEIASRREPISIKSRDLRARDYDTAKGQPIGA